MSLIVKSQIKEYVQGYNVSGDFGDALSAKVEMLIREAVKRAEANSRRTVMAKDL